MQTIFLNSYLDLNHSVGLVEKNFRIFGNFFLWVKNAVQNCLLPLTLFVFRLRSIWDGFHVTSSKV